MLSFSLFFFFLLTLIGGLIGSIFSLQAEPTNNSNNGYHSYIIIDNETGCILEEYEASHKQAVASLTKLALGVIAIDAKQIHHQSLAAPVTVPAGMILPNMPNQFDLEEGDTISARDLLYLTLLASDPVASRILAYHLGKQLPNPEQLAPIENSVSHMNMLARDLDMDHTRFLNPQGSDRLANGAASFSTAADLARLTRYAYSKPGIPFYVLQKKRKISLTRKGKKHDITIKNTNEILGKDLIDGVKTGSSKTASQCLILSSRRPTEVRQDGNIFYKTPRRIIIVLLGSTDRFTEGLALNKHGWKLYHKWAKAGRPSYQHSYLGS